MACYAIFLPGVQGANPEHLVNVGLAELLKDGSAEFADVLDGSPDGSRGLLVTWRLLHSAEQSLAVKDYEWKPAKADKARGLKAKRFWIGLPKGAKVEPRDTARRSTVAGYPVELADGQCWIIPAAVNLPATLGLNDDGELQSTIAEEYRDFWQQSERYAVQFFSAIDKLALLQAKRPKIASAETVEFTLADAWAFACQAIAINYRLTPELIDCLGLFDHTAIRNVIKATIDLVAILEMNAQKKTSGVVSIPVS